LVEYPLANPDGQLSDLSPGPDGNLWAPYYCCPEAIARITPAGVITDFAVPGSGGAVISAGADKNLWFQAGGPNVYRMTTDGATITPFNISSRYGGTGDITLGPDGNVWFTESQAGYVDRVTPAGVVTSFKTTGNDPTKITAGPDGNVWFTDPFANTVSRITPSGVITDFKAPPGPESAGPYGITVGGDGNLWYTNPGARVIGRVTPTGVFTEFYLPAGVGNTAFDITKDSDGNLWFDDRGNNLIGRITTGGKVGVFSVATSATPYSSPANITTGPDGRLWFTMQAPGRVAAFAPFAPKASRPEIRTIVSPDSTTTGGDTVLITGYGIGTATQVLFGTTPATSFHSVGPSQIEAVVPPQAAGVVNVTIVTPTGKTAASTPSKFFYSSLACGKVITKNTTLGSDIGPCYHDGVIVQADNVSLDLGGKRIFGFAEPADGNAAGIRLPGRTGVTVKNGTVSGFDAGIVVDGGGSNTLTSLTVKDNIGVDDFQTTLGDGIFIEDSAHNNVNHNVISHNGIYDGVGIFGPSASYNSITNNLVENTVGTSARGPAGQGIIINGASEGAVATHIESTRVANNVVRDNASAGIANINHVKGTIEGNVVTGNGATNGVGNGIGVTVGFIWDPAVPTEMLIKGNQVHGNGVDGIRIGAPPRYPGAPGAVSGNKILDNDAANNNVNPAANGYEGSPPAFDLHDASDDCAGNTWRGNIWGSGGYSPPCTTNGGHGPTVPAMSSNAATAAGAGGPSDLDVKAWEQFINRGR